MTAPATTACDLSILGIVPGMRVAAPRDGARLREELGEALEVDNGPTAIRFPPKGEVGEDIPALERVSGMDLLARPADGLSQDVLLVAVGSFASMALKVAQRLRNQGIGGVTVVDPRWVLPVPDGIAPLATSHKLVVTMEDSGVHGGIGSTVSATCGPRASTCHAAISVCRNSSSTTPAAVRCSRRWA